MSRNFENHPASNCLGDLQDLGGDIVDGAHLTVANAMHGDLSQLTAMLPGVAPLAVGEGVADGVVGYGVPVIPGQQITPGFVAVYTENGPLYFINDSSGSLLFLLNSIEYAT